MMPGIKKGEQCDLPQQSQRSDEQVESSREEGYRGESCDNCGPSDVTSEDKESERES